MSQDKKPQNHDHWAGLSQSLNLDGELFHDSVPSPSAPESLDFPNPQEPAMEEHSKPQETPQKTSQETPSPRKRRDPWSLLASQLGLLSSPIAPNVAEAATRTKPSNESPIEVQAVEVADFRKEPVVEETVVAAEAETIMSDTSFDEQGEELPSVLWKPKKVSSAPPSASPSKSVEIKSPFASRQSQSSDPPRAPRNSDRQHSDMKPETKQDEIEEPIPVSAFSSGVGRQNRDKRSQGREDRSEVKKDNDKANVREPESRHRDSGSRVPSNNDSGSNDFSSERKPRRESRKPVDVEKHDTPVAKVRNSYGDDLDAVSFEPKIPDRSRRSRGRKTEPVVDSVADPFEDQLLSPVFEDEIPEDQPKRPRRRRQEPETVTPQKPARTETKKEPASPLPDFSQLHKKIPSWDDAIGMIIDANMERSPNRGSGSRKPNPRGRRR